MVTLRQDNPIEMGNSVTVTLRHWKQFSAFTQLYLSIPITGCDYKSSIPGLYLNQKLVQDLKNIETIRYC